MAQVMDAYYDLAGWDKKTGNPTRATLRRLDLGWVLGEPAARQAAPARKKAAKKRIVTKKAAKKKAVKAKKPAKKTKKKAAKRKK